MQPTPTSATLPQLLERYRAVSTKSPTGEFNDLISLTFHSTAIEGSSLSLAQIRNLIQNGQPLSGKSSTDQWQVIDHHQALEQMLTMATERDPLNRIAFQDVAATLMARTGGLTHSLLSCFDTSKGELRIHDAISGRRPLVTARKLPAAIDELFKSINTRISQLNTPRQIYTLSFEAHFELLTLHPFGKGNGPMARLLMNYIQRYHQLPLSGVYIDYRVAYLTTLEASWRQKMAVPIVDFMHSQLIWMLEQGIA